MLLMLWLINTRKSAVIMKNDMWARNKYSRILLPGEKFFSVGLHRLAVMVTVMVILERIMEVV